MATAAIARPSSIHSQRRSPLSTTTTYPSKNTMSITQTYYLAHKARGKLSREAAQPDHDLRLLVGHANLLDSLMFELAEAEREQERFFNQAVRGNKASPKKSTVEQQRHIQWADRIEEEAFEDDSSSDSDSDSDFDEEDLSVPAPRATVSRQDADIEVDDDEEEDFAQLELVRTTSHNNSPPDLIDHDSDSSEDEHMPPSPTDAALPLPDKQAKAEQEMFHDDFYSSRQHNHGLVSSVMVY